MKVVIELHVKSPHIIESCYLCKYWIGQNNNPSSTGSLVNIVVQSANAATTPSVNSSR